MKITQSHLGNFVLTLLLFFCLILIARESLANSETETEDTVQDGKVEILYSPDELTTYKERKQDRSFLFSVSVDNLILNQFKSPIDDQLYEDLFGEQTIPLVQLDLGIKQNFGFGGVYASFIIGKGEVSERTSGQLTTMNLQKKGISLGLIADRLFQEPYVAPYISWQLFNFDWEERTEFQGSKHGETGLANAVQGGVLFQLNWLDPDTALDGQRSSNLTNTYLDLFVSQYNTSDRAEDPDFQTGVNFGFGLRLEY